MSLIPQMAQMDSVHRSRAHLRDQRDLRDLRPLLEDVMMPDVPSVGTIAIPRLRACGAPLGMTLLHRASDGREQRIEEHLERAVRLRAIQRPEPEHRDAASA